MRHPRGGHKAALRAFPPEAGRGLGLRGAPSLDVGGRRQPGGADPPVGGTAGTEAPGPPGVAADTQPLAPGLPARPPTGEKPAPPCPPGRSRPFTRLGPDRAGASDGRDPTAAPWRPRGPAPRPSCPAIPGASPPRCPRPAAASSGLGTQTPAPQRSPCSGAKWAPRGARPGHPLSSPPGDYL